MNYLSTRGQSGQVPLETALRAGLAPDGGLFVPERIPTFAADAFVGSPSLPATAEGALAPFFSGSVLEDRLGVIARDALDLPLPIVEFEPGCAWMLELFHGPTAAFKDFAARFLAACLAQLRSDTDPTQTVLVATSGDTGGAVAAAFHRRPGFRVVILYPDGRVSARQAHQLGAFGDNVHCYKVQGNFDDCQRLAKQALNDAEPASALALTSANSISIGRLLPQISYYVYAASKMADSPSEPINLIIPTGNLGNALGAVMARSMGAPIGEVLLATNANPTLPEFFSGLDYRGRPGIATLANAMDVGDPSNFERLAWLFRDQDLRAIGVNAVGVTDQAIEAIVRDYWNERGMAVCPHTACGLEALRQLRDRGDDRRWMVAATAHAAKFDNVVEPLIGAEVPVPAALADLLARPSNATALATDYAKLKAALQGLSGSRAL
jgi:threonine synthase